MAGSGSWRRVVVVTDLARLECGPSRRNNSVAYCGIKQHSRNPRSSSMPVNEIARYTPETRGLPARHETGRPMTICSQVQCRIAVAAPAEPPILGCAGVSQCRDSRARVRWVSHRCRQAQIHTHTQTARAPTLGVGPGRNPVQKPVEWVEWVERANWP